VNLQKEYGDRGLMVIGVSLDEGDSKLVRTFAKRMTMNYLRESPAALACGAFQFLPSGVSFNKVRVGGFGQHGDKLQ
jgi:hypothetical protein